MAADDGVVLRLQADEALVLFAWLARFNADGAGAVDAAEQRVVWDLEALLEEQLPAVVSVDYAAAVEAARLRVVAERGNPAP